MLVLKVWAKSGRPVLVPLPQQFTLGTESRRLPLKEHEHRGAAH